MNAPHHALAPTPARSLSCAPHELPGLLDRFPEARVLSLDCFDTLIWRDCHAPTDVFAALPGLLPVQRAGGEARARQVAAAHRGLADVPIAAIYESAMPFADAPTRMRAIEAELAAEIRHARAFAPTVALMRAARARAARVILVSDTYFDARQLLRLVEGAAGAEVAALIDAVFTSSMFGKPKAGGLYGDVLARLGERAGRIVHVGDNAAADVAGVAPFGVHTVHLRQFEPAIEAQLRLESTVSGLLEIAAPGALARPQPHRAALALTLPQSADPAWRLGAAVLGPLFAGFDRWLRGEAAALAQRGGRVHWLFLLRDGHLPLKIYRALGAAPSAHAVEISRMTASFATLTTPAALGRFLDDNLATRAPALARMLRLDDADVARVCAGRDPQAARTALGEWAMLGANRRRIAADARAFAARMVAHVRATADPAPGDTLMLVDLGYNGTVQNLAGPILAEALGVHVAGRYLLLRETLAAPFDKAGWIDRRHYDGPALGALAANVAIVEQLATVAMGSVIDYADDGTPIRRDSTIKARQSAVREAAQAGALAYAAETMRAAVRKAQPDDADRQHREAGAATLARLMFLPQPHEVDVLAAFEHDVNLGSDEMIALFDPGAAREGLRRQGLFYQKAATRMFLPAELAGEGLPLALANLAATRVAAPLTFGDVTQGAAYVPVVFVRDGEDARAQCPARVTHDGFRALAIPLGRARDPVAVQIGAVGRHVEVTAIYACRTADFVLSRVRATRDEYPLVPMLDGIEECAPGLWRCASAYAFALLRPPALPAIDDLMLVMIYRAIGS